MVLCCAVICQCEFEEASRRRVAMRITEDAEGEAGSFRGSFCTRGCLTVSSVMPDNTDKLDFQ